MTLIVVPIAVDSATEVASALERAAQAAKAGAAMVEWRIDALAMEENCAEAVVRLVRESPVPCILTCRTASEGGDFTGTDESRLFLLESLASAGHMPRYVDIELAAFERQPAAWIAAILGGGASAASETSIILSVHDFKGRPADLLRRVETMTNDRACNVIKVAWQARSLRDNLQAFDLLSERKKPMIALCMGRFGLMSRVLAPKFGGFLTFAAMERGEETASGQPTIDELRHAHRFDLVGRETKVYGVIGWPVEHSLSPLIHNKGFEKIGYDGVYLSLPIPGDSKEPEHFKATVGELVDHPRLHFRGASVTVPHKENLLRFVEERGGRVDPLARLAGAANTLLVGATGALACRNTDSPAIVECLCDALNVNAPLLKDRTIALLGAGGVARAAAAGLIQHGASVTIFNRTRPRAESLVSDLRVRAAEAGISPKLTIGDPGQLVKPGAGAFDVYINCTTVGMTGGSAPSRTPFEAIAEKPVSITESMTLFDTVYTPSRTPLIEEAESRGARVVLGIDLFIRQAALQFEGWTGEAAPVDTWRDVLRHGEVGRTRA